MYIFKNNKYYLVLKQDILSIAQRNIYVYFNLI